MNAKSLHITTVILLLLTTAPLVLLLFLQGYQLQLKHTAFARMKEEKLLTLSLVATEVAWEKKGKEIIVGGRMFDLKHFHIKNGILTATGYFDEKELGIIGFIHGHAGHNPATDSLVRLLLLVQCLAIPLRWLCNFFQFQTISTPLFCWHCLYPRPLIAIHTPPPWFY